MVGKSEAADNIGDGLVRILTYPPFYVVVGGLLLCNDVVRTDLLVGGSILCGLIFLYGFLSRRLTGVEPSEIGDNCYFIGFIFTLVVICLSIYLDGSRDATGTEKLLHSVSVGLITSVGGILARFIISYGIREADQDLDSKVRMLSSEVARLSIALQDSVVVTRQYNSKLKDETSTLGENLNRELIRLLEDLAEKTHEALSKVHFDRVHSELTRAVDAHVGAVGLVVTSLDRVGDRLVPVASKIERVSESLSSAVDGVKASLADSNWESIGESFGLFSEKAIRMSEVADQMVEKYGKMAKDADVLTEQFDGVRTNFQHAVEIMRQDIDEVIRIKRQYRESFDQAAKESIRETHKLYSRLITGANVAISNIERWETLVKRLENWVEQERKTGDSDEI